MLLQKKNKNLFFYLNFYFIIISKIYSNLSINRFTLFSNFFFFLKKINYFYLIKKNKFFLFNTDNVLSNYFYSEKYNLLENNVKTFTKFNKTKNFIFFNKTLKYKLFNLFFLFNKSFSTNLSNKLNFHNFFYISSKNSTLVLLNVSKVLLKWQNTNDLLINIFYYNNYPIIFSTLYFKIETLALNWTHHKWNYLLWKYYYNFFYFKFNKNTDYADYFFSKLNDLQIDFLIITDTNYHYKNLFFFRHYKKYTIGLVDMNTNPWIVDYPVLMIFNNFLFQLYFFKLLIFFKKIVFLKKYYFFKKKYFLTLF